MDLKLEVSGHTSLDSLGWVEGWVGHTVRAGLLLSSYPGVHVRVLGSGCVFSCSSVCFDPLIHVKDLAGAGGED